MRTQVRLHGGSVSEGITDSTTHVVVLPAAGSPAGASEPAAAQPGQVLAQLLRDHGGLPALKTLHRRLLSQQAHIVAQTWVPCNQLISSSFCSTVSLVIGRCLLLDICKGRSSVGLGTFCSWLDQCLATLEQKTHGQVPHRVPEAEHPFTLDGSAAAPPW